MKKKHSSGDGLFLTFLAKGIRIMKLTAVFLFIGCLHVAATGFSQEAKVTLDLKEVNIPKLLKVIEKQTGYRFIYSNDILPKQFLLSVVANATPVSAVLKQALEKTDLTFNLIDDESIVLSKKIPEAVAIVVTGKVTDEAGNPLQGVSVYVKGNPSIGTITNEKGYFTLSVPDNTTTLIFSSIGMTQLEKELEGKRELSVTLKKSDNQQQEVVVIGYGTQRRDKLASAVVTISGDQLNKRVATDATTLLQGQLPGLQVVQNSGEPGNESVNLRIRGIGTFSGAGNDPLIIVDGIPGSLTALNPTDIASVSVLKDAASAAVYGARGANGVILVTTKKGSSGRFSLSYNYNLGIAKATKLPKLITNSAEYMQLSNEARTNSGLSDIYTQAEIDEYANATDRNKYPNHNWLDDMFAPAYVQNHYMNASGSNGKTNYSVGLGYVDQPGIMRSFSFKKYTIQTNLSSEITKNITFGFNNLFYYSRKQGAAQGSGDQFLSTLAQTPLYKPKLWDGSGHYTYRAFASEAAAGNKNPVAIAENVNAYTDSYYAQVNGHILVKPLKGLTWETRAGANFYFNKTNDFRPYIPQYYYSDLSLVSSQVDVGSLGLNIYQYNGIYTVLYSQLTYDRQWGDHHMTLLGGAQQEQNMDQTLIGSRLAYATNFLRELDAGPVTGESNSGNTTRWAIRSFYGRANYDYQNKYLLEGSMRNDGTSRLPAYSRWGLFYAGSAAWRISEEGFLKNKFQWLDDLKIRGSFGKLGNQNIGTYPYQKVLTSSYYYIDNTVTTGYYASGLVDSSLTWETTQVLNLGIDLALLNNRLTVTADWFNKKTYNILRSYQVPLYVGLTAPTVNNGEVGNKGFEINAQFTDKLGKNLSYTVGGNVQVYHNKLLKYGSTDINGNQIYKEGLPMGSFWLYQWEGIFQSTTDISKHATQPIAPAPGDLKFKDINGDGVINSSDMQYVKGAYPVASYAFNLGLSWKGLDLAAQIYGSYGQKIYATGWGTEPFRQGSVPTTDWRNAWTTSNPTNTMPRIYDADSYPAVENYYSTYFLKSASYVRLKNLQIGYQVPATWTSRAKLQSLRIYVSGNNLITITKFPYFDPERVGNSFGSPSYPQTKNFVFGATLQF